MYQFGQASKSVLIGVHPNLMRVIKEAIKTSPFDFTIVEGVRTTARQQQLYAQGRATKGPIVTYADGVRKKSNHQPKADGYGYAIDFVPFINGRTDWNADAEFTLIARHIQKVGSDLGIRITWGGDWKRPVDKPHIELAK
ncbi:M15 family peptidase [Mucilaginibacter hurinus]|uniref:M15 family peptidase n=1 Tax=Mucilaginibacter hurinus TaxID=2201324 RepID=A0A367GKG0_9SPHI|nr:M15 family metallopeptidase [Mucilaginibacter hurinus]RCH53952.1 M15 family peptidase [Mucilaginibacter hurinus]